MAVNDPATAIILSILLLTILKVILAKVKPKAKAIPKYLASGGTIEKAKL